MEEKNKNPICNLKDIDDSLLKAQMNNIDNLGIGEIEMPDSLQPRDEKEIDIYLMTHNTNIGGIKNR